MPNDGAEAKPGAAAQSIANTPATRRLAHILSSITSSQETIGELTIGGITHHIRRSLEPSRLVHLREEDLLAREYHLEDGQGNGTRLAVNSTSVQRRAVEGPQGVVGDLKFVLQKYLLGQDVFLLGQPGVYARRLAMTFAKLINTEYEYVALHRDVGETELKQGREIRPGGKLTYVDSPAVRAVKYGRVLILEGVEKAERGIMPLLNNLLENREMNLDDGTHIVHPQRFASLSNSSQKGPSQTFIPAHPNFFVIAIAAPVPPYPGYPLDPPFRSRFQARYVDPVGALVGLAERPIQGRSNPIATGGGFYEALKTLILSTQLAAEARGTQEGGSISASVLKPFPQTALMKLSKLLDIFPVSCDSPPTLAPLTPTQLARLVLTLHPALIYAPFQAWAILSRQCEELGLGPLGSPVTAELDDSSSGDEDGSGLLGYRVVRIERVGQKERTITITFVSPAGGPGEAQVDVPGGPGALLPFPFSGSDLDFVPTSRFISLLTTFLQAHALGWDVSLIPPAHPSTASCSSSTLVRVFADVLGYVRGRGAGESLSHFGTVYMYKEMGGREIVMRREVVRSHEGQKEGTLGADSVTVWKPSAVVQSAWDGRVVCLEGVDVVGATAGAIARLCTDREVEVWEGQRIVGQIGVGKEHSDITTVHPSFRIVTTASKTQLLKDWLSDEHANMFFTIPSIPMSRSEERAVLLKTGCAPNVVDALQSFAESYRTQTGSLHGGEKGAHGQSHSAIKNRRLGTRTLVRMAERLKTEADVGGRVDLWNLVERTLLTEFMPPTERMVIQDLLKASQVDKGSGQIYPDPILDVENRALVFPAASSANGASPATLPTFIPMYNPERDVDGSASLVPHMSDFYNNPLQTSVLRSLALDLELLGAHLVLLGNQGVGKNKLIDRLLQLLGRPREYIQLHRDTTVQSLVYTTVVEGGIVKYVEGPLLRGVRMGRVVVVDEADKAPEHVVGVLRSLSRGGMTLPDGRWVGKGGIEIGDGFRLVVLANRPGYPFLGNHFLQVLGENFNTHAVGNPDPASERRIIRQLAPALDPELVGHLVDAFQDLRRTYEAGTLGYPYSLRELINLVKHVKAYPNDSLGESLRNVFDFDAFRPDMMGKLVDILERHNLDVSHLGFEAAREAARLKAIALAKAAAESKESPEREFKPKETSLSEPKEGQHDDKEHSGGNKWAGGTGGRDTAGMGGRGGFKRYYKGGEIKQVSDELKEQVPEHIREKAREMARQELKRRLEELDMSASEARGYSQLLDATSVHMASLLDLLEHLAAKEEERVWIKRQTDGELDDGRLTEGLTGESTVYKRRGMEKPEMGRPQLKPKRIKFIFDLSASMYRFQYDGRLQRSAETAVMLMETFDRLSRKEKYVWDMCGHSGDGPDIELVSAEKPPADLKTRWKVVEKMNMVPQYAFAGDYTVEAIAKGVHDVAKYDADDWFVIAITDANFGRYNITKEDLNRALRSNPKVNTALICIGEGATAEAGWVMKAFPGKAFGVKDTGDIPGVLRSILSTMVDR